MGRTAAYGSWKSPITAAEAARNDGRPNWPAYVGEEVWWTEPRPAEDGRVALVRRRPDGTETDVLPAPWNVRSRVHEYGGRCWVASPGADAALVVFAHFPDQRLYRNRPDQPDADPTPLTPQPSRPCGLRYIEPFLPPADGPGAGEVWCIREEITGDEPSDLRRSLVAVPLDGSAATDPAAVRELARDGHFLACPRLSPDGRRLAWITWEHPNMPWDSTELRVAEVDEHGCAGKAHTVAGGEDEAVVQLEWNGPHQLLAVTDPAGWWNLYRIALDSDGTPHEPVNLCPMPEDFGGPLWNLGQRWFVPLRDGLLAVLHGRGAQRLSVLDPVSGTLRDAPGPYPEWTATLDVNGSRVVGVAAGPERSHEVVELDATTGQLQVRGATHRDLVDPGYLPGTGPSVFTTPDGHEIHAHTHLPGNADHQAPDDELPPLVVWAHGGPTGRSPHVYDLEIAYFTSRGIGVVEVNYGGSTGYGRAYRERLRHNWGVVDIGDAAFVARSLAEQGLADPARLAIRGGSAGGFTSAQALTSDADDVAGTFSCATISYPVLDLVAFGTGETHDMESRYVESLVGPYPAESARYEERSPVRHVDRVTQPFLLLQGLDDVICPPVHAERFLAALRGRDVPHAYLSFTGEQHGFRKQETMVACLEAELSLYGQVFGFTPVGIAPLALRTEPAE